jgi:hypothetical protein
VVALLAEDLQHAALCAWNGLLYAAGWAEGAVWFEYSEDNGRTAAPLPGGGTRSFICTAEEQQPAIEVLTTAELVVAVDREGQVATYYSTDQGRTWQPAA